MLKRHHRFFQSMQVMRDLALVAISFALAYLGRFSFPDLLPFHSVSPPREVLWVGIVATLLWPGLGFVGGLYTSRRTRSVAAEVFDVLKVSLGTLLVLVALTYFAREERFSRGVLILWAILSVVVVSAARVASRLAMGALRRRGYNLRHVVVVGSGAFAERVIATVLEHASLGLHVIGVVTPERRDSACFAVPVLGTVRELAAVVRAHRADQVIAALTIDELGALKDVMAELKQQPVDVRVIPDFYQYMTLCGGVDELAGLPVINLQATPLWGWNLVAKRTFDLGVAGASLLVLSPLLVLVAAAIRLTSGSPVLFRQERVGMDGRRFVMLKFRTMREGASDGAQMTTPHDPRRTRLGALLRRTSLDELPQLWNVLKGEMSLVGPRPEQPAFVEDFTRDIPRYALRHKIKAGMTGWAQVQGLRGNTSMTKRIELDLYYIENWSFLLDLKILVRTLLGGFTSPHAY